jgi:hypothetical protein
VCYSGCYKICYDDGEEELLNLAKEKFTVTTASDKDEAPQKKKNQKPLAMTSSQKKKNQKPLAMTSQTKKRKSDAVPEKPNNKRAAVSGTCNSSIALVGPRNCEVCIPSGWGGAASQPLYQTILIPTPSGEEVQVTLTLVPAPGAGASVQRAARHPSESSHNEVNADQLLCLATLVVWPYNAAVTEFE